MQLEQLNVEEITLGETRLEQYRRTAGVFSGGVLLSLVGFLWKSFRRMTGHGSRDDSVVLGVLLVVVVVAGALTWFFGWKQVFALKRDLSAGRKGRLQGQVEWLDRQKNAYGQTVTHLRVQGKRASSREASMEVVQKGDYVELVLLPESGVILSCRPSSVA